MNDIQTALANLEAKGWTQAAIAREVAVSYNAVQKWKAGDRSPANHKLVLERLEQMNQRKRIPKKRLITGA